MSEKHFGESGEVKKANEQMTEDELNELFKREIPEGGEMPVVSEEDIQKTKEAIEKETNKNPER